MKLITVLLLVLIVAAVSSATLPAQFVTEKETITQLIWNRHDALLVSGMRRDGWRGNYLRYGLLVLKGVFGDIPEYESTRYWVIVAHITPDGVQRQVAEGAVFPMLRPAEGTMYWGNNPLLKWNGREFVLAVGEANSVAGRTRPPNPNYDDVEGWSSRTNLLNQEDEQVTVSFDLNGSEVTIIAERTADRSQKSVKVMFEDGRTQELVSMSQGHRLVSSADYEALMTER